MVQTRVFLALAGSLATVFIVASLAAASSHIGYPASEPSGLIAFTRWDGIYVVRADGTGERPLRHGGVAAGADGISWSPDGRKLAFTSRGAIWAMAADGTHLARVVTPAQIPARVFGTPTWSPDGRRIAFIAFGTKRPNIWVVNADGANAHRLLRTPTRSEYQVDWSPSGDRIAFIDAASWFMRLYVMRTNGTHLRAVYPQPIFQAAMPRWSPRGQSLAFMAWPRWGSLSSTEIRVGDVRGRSRQLTHNTVTDSNPAWSPDGTKIVFLRGCDEDMLFIAPEKHSPGEIYFMNADGTGVTRLTHNQVAEGSPAWQPTAASS